MFKRLIAIELITITAALLSQSHGIYKQYGDVTGPDEIITENGHIWGYDTLPEIGSRVKVLFDDMGTPDDVTDDTIVLVTEI